MNEEGHTYHSIMDNEEEEDEFHDAEEGSHMHFLVEVEDEDDENDEDYQDDGAANEEEDEDEDEDEDDTAEASTSEDAARAAIQRRILALITGNGRRGQLTQHQVFSYLRRSNLGSLLFDDEDYGRRRRRRNQDPDRFPKVPSDMGRELMRSGTFGVTDLRSPFSAQKSMARRILDRELGVRDTTGQRVNKGMMAQSMLPTTDAEMIINYDEPVYSGQFSDDGNFFYACVKDFRVRMYDTSDPYNWRHYKTVAFPGGSWTLTDASLSPDNRWLAYTSIQHNVCLAPTDPNDTGDPYTLNLAEGNTRRGGWGGAFGIWSIRFSGDGRELVAGTNSNSIVVYDIESRRVLHNIEGHDHHVNAVCFADKSSPHILYSGSDDTTIKVWDTRSLGDRREAGAFVGHIEGLTYIDSKGDGRYILSNAKDQSMKLWDLKMMYTTAEFRERNPRQHIAFSEFDYRWETYDDNDWFPHPDDNSLVTFRGHKVLRTLIRCHFSPPGSTDSRYVYTGSHDGKVYIYNMDATIAKIIDVKKATTNARSLPSRWREFHRGRQFQGWATCVRDASWHPNAPFIAASALNGWDHALGTVTLHSYNEASVDEGEPRMGTGYSDKLIPVDEYDDTRVDSDDDESDYGFSM